MVHSKLLQLPFEILFIIHPFLTEKQYKYLLDTTKLFLELKKRTVYWKITANHSYIIYLHQESSFTERLFSKVQNTKYQIELNLSYYRNIKHLPLQLTERIHGVNMSNCADIKDASSLDNLLTINLSNCHNLQLVNTLGNVRILNLSNCQGIIDVSSLGTVETLNLSGCLGIRDVSRLGGVKNLILKNCKNIQDVSMLFQVENLDLSYCDQLIDVSSLTKNRKLNLCNCKNLTTSSPNLNLYSLNISGCAAIYDFHFIRTSTIFILHISACPQIDDVSIFHRISKLVMIGCPQVTESSMLKETKVIRV